MPVLSDGTLIDVDLPTPKIFDVDVISGPRGPVGGGTSFEHIQTTPSASWSITVPPEMGRTPGVAIYVGGILVLADVEANSSTVNITFPTAVSGSVVLT